MKCEHGNLQNDCTQCRAIAEAEHKASEEASLISMGMDLGVYAMSQLFATGKYSFTPKDWERFGWHAAMSLERETGKPAEDLVMAIMPTIEAALKSVFEKHNGGTPQ